MASSSGGGAPQPAESTGNRGQRSTKWRWRDHQALFPRAVEQATGGGAPQPAEGTANRGQRRPKWRWHDHQAFFHRAIEEAKGGGAPQPAESTADPPDAIALWQACFWRRSGECRHVIHVLLSRRAKTQQQECQLAGILAQHLPPFITPNTAEAFFTMLELGRDISDHNLCRAVLDFYNDRPRCTYNELLHDSTVAREIHACLPKGVPLWQWMTKRLPLHCGSVAPWKCHCLCDDCKLECCLQDNNMLPAGTPTLKPRRRLTKHNGFSKKWRRAFMLRRVGQLYE